MPRNGKKISKSSFTNKLGILFIILIIAAVLSKIIFLTLGPRIDDPAYFSLSQTAPGFKNFLLHSITGTYFRLLSNFFIYIFAEKLHSVFLLRLFNTVVYFLTAYLLYLIAPRKKRSIFLLLFLSTPVFFDNFIMSVGTGDFLYLFLGALCYYLLTKQRYFWAAAMLLLSFLAKENALIFLFIGLLVFSKNIRAVIALLSSAAIYLLIHSAYFIPVGTSETILSLKYFIHLLFSGIILTVFPVIPTMDLVNFILRFSNVYTTVFVFVLVVMTYVYLSKKKLEKHDSAALKLLAILYFITLTSFYFLKIVPVFSYRNVIVMHVLILYIASGNINKKILYAVSLVFIAESFFIFHLAINESDYYKFNLKLVPDSPAFLYAVGVDYYKKTDYPTASRYLKRALSISKNTDKIRSALIASLKKQSRMTEAHNIAKPFEKKLLAEKNYAQLGKLYEGIADYRAIQYYEKAKAYKKLGLLFLKNNEEDSAAIAFEKYTKNNIDSEVMLKLSYLYIKTKKLKKAIHVLTQLLNNEPDNVDALNNIGIAAAMSGHIKIAEAYFKKALNLNPKYKKTKQNLQLLNKIKMQSKKAPSK